MKGMERVKAEAIYAYYPVPDYLKDSSVSSMNIAFNKTDEMPLVYPTLRQSFSPWRAAIYQPWDAREFKEILSAKFW